MGDKGMTEERRERKQREKGEVKKSEGEVPQQKKKCKKSSDSNYSMIL